ncbi:hypothetical protein [Nonomuraea sp. JJY05]|uniref:hypothetical protein n=1 Tax=Nonomuraea sp. JJY05 TaxID=3350255 RepID=UPI00373F6627
MDGNLDRAAVALLRKLKPEIQQEFLQSEEFRSLSAADRDRVYEIDAELSEAERQRKAGGADPPAKNPSESPRLLPLRGVRKAWPHTLRLDQSSKWNPNAARISHERLSH